MGTRLKVLRFSSGLKKHSPIMQAAQRRSLNHEPEDGDQEEKNAPNVRYLIEKFNQLGAISAPPESQKQKQPISSNSPRINASCEVSELLSPVKRYNSSAAVDEAKDVNIEALTLSSSVETKRRRSSISKKLAKLGIRLNSASTRPHAEPHDKHKLRTPEKSSDNRNSIVGSLSRAKSFLIGSSKTQELKNYSSESTNCSNSRLVAGRRSTYSSFRLYTAQTTPNNHQVQLSGASNRKKTINYHYQSTKDAAAAAFNRSATSGNCTNTKRTTAV